jgi:hypothetical protein
VQETVTPLTPDPYTLLLPSAFCDIKGRPTVSAHLGNGRPVWVLRKPGKLRYPGAFFYPFFTAARFSATCFQFTTFHQASMYSVRLF